MRLKDIDEAAWAALYAEWKSSKMTQEDFCKTKGLGLRDFIYRREKSFLNKKRAETKKSLSAPRFLKLESEVAPINTPVPEVKKQEPNFIELVLPHGIILRIPA